MKITLKYTAAILAMIMSTALVAAIILFLGVLTVEGYEQKLSAEMTAAFNKATTSFSVPELD